MRRCAAALLFLVLALGLLTARAPNDLLTSGKVDAANVAWMLTATALVMLMTPGLSFFYGGMVRGKNVISTLLQSFIALAVVSLLWVVFGFSLVFGESWGGIIGDPRTFLMLRGVTAVDDSLDVFPCHGVGGLTGMLLTAVFASKGGLIHGSGHLIGVHLLAMLAVVPAVYVLASLLYRFVDSIVPLRVSERDEAIGLDLSQHGESIYESVDRSSRLGQQRRSEESVIAANVAA